MPATVSSETQICNNALLRLGTGPITSLSDETDVSDSCAALYSVTRDSLLRQHFWAFATKRVNLSAAVAAPLFEWNLQYTLPSDFIRFKYIYRSSYPYKIEGPLLLTNQIAPLPIVYIARIEDVSEFDPLFVEILTLRLAILLGPRIIGGSFNHAILTEELKPLLLEAKLVNAQDQTPDDWEVNTFVDSRQGVPANVPFTVLGDS